VKKKVEAWVIGGDGRYAWAARQLRQDGMPVKCWGVPGMEDQAESLEAALSGADIVLLPMKPFEAERLRVRGEEIQAAMLPYILSRNAVLVAGSFPVEVESWLQTKGVRCVSFLELEGYLLSNAEITAEGAVYLLLHHLHRTLSGANILVIGYGRIGRFLAGKLRFMGAKVTVTARRSQQLEELTIRGYETEETGVYAKGLGQYDAVVNTVPGSILTMEQVMQLDERCILLELASLPGGVPGEAKGKRNVVMGQALPGKTAPETAGKNLAEAVWSCLHGEGRTLE
jgi:dipicolinate synthase subunit A